MKKSSIFLVALLGLSLASCGNTNTNALKGKDAESTTTWTVTLDLNYEGGGTYKTFEVDRQVNGTNIKTLIENEKPTREEHEFLGWYHDSYCKVEWVYMRDKVLADTTLYASWKSTALPKTTINWVNDDSFTYVGELSTTVNQGSEVTFGIKINDGYEGTPVVKANSTVLEATDGLYKFTADTNTIKITVTGLTKIKSELDVIRIYFTLPSGWTPIAENPRLYYWGSQTISDSIFTLGASSNMASDDGKTYYIDLESSISFDGMIIIFDQGSEVKQSYNISDNLPTSAGEYQIIVDDWAAWDPNEFGVWCFHARIEAL